MEEEETDVFSSTGDMIFAKQIGKRLDSDLKAFLEAEDEKNNGKVLYIRRGKIDFETGENLFNVTPLTPAEE